MEKIHETCMFCAFMYILQVNMKSTKTYFHVHSPFSAYFYPLLHHNGKGLYALEEN